MEDAVTGTQVEKAFSGREIIPRHRRKVVWRGKTCVIAVPNGPPESYGGQKPLSSVDVQARLRQWQDAGFDIDGFDLADTRQVNDTLAQVRPSYPDPGETLVQFKTKDFPVRVPDPGAWQAYVNWLTEEKLKALGVSLGDDDVEPSRTLSRQNSAQAAPHSQRSTPGLSSFSTESHSRTMSTASPPSATGDYRGHAARHSVYTMPFGFQQVQHPGMRSLSPAQQANIATGQRSLSPGLERFKNNGSPIVSPASPGLSQYRPSPLSADQRATPPMHLRHQSVASAFPAPQMQTSQSRHALTNVPEDEEDSSQQLRPPTLSRGSSSEIAIPTPRGHRHNISETLDREIREAEALLVERSAHEDQSRSAVNASQHRNDFRSEAFSFPQQGTPMLFQGGTYSSAQNNHQLRQSQGHKSQFSVAAPEFHFNPNGPSLFGSSSTSNIRTRAQQPMQARLSAGHHSRHESAFNAAAPPFRPMAQSSMPTSSFNFTSAHDPTAASVAPQSLSEPTPIFGNVIIPDNADTSRRSRTVPVVQPFRHTKAGSEDLEDAEGRPVQSDDRQKRARKTQDDGDSVPRFAERPHSPPRSEHSLPIKSITHDLATTDDPVHQRDVVEQDLSSLTADTVDAQRRTSQDLMKSRATNVDQTRLTSDRGADRLASIPLGQSHVRNKSSLSALAQPFVVEPSTAGGADGSSERSETPDEHDVDEDEALGKTKPDLSPERVFSSESTKARRLVTSPPSPDPQKSTSFAIRNIPSPEYIEPSFEEIDTVMRHLSERANAEQERFISPIMSPARPRSRSEAGRSDAPSPASVKMQDSAAATPEPVSPLPSGVQSTSLQLRQADVRHRDRHGDAPISESSDDFLTDAPFRLDARGRTLDEGVDSIVSNTFRDQLLPLQDAVYSIHRTVMKMASSRERRPRMSSGADSDADDEDDIMDSKFLSQRTSSSRDKKHGLIREAMLEALDLHQQASRQLPQTGDIQDLLASTNTMIAGLASAHLDHNDVRVIVEDALHNQNRMLVHAPLPVGDSQKDANHRRTMSELEGRLNETLTGALEEANQRHAAEEREADTRRRLRLTEEEVILIQETLSDKEHKIHALENDNSKLKRHLDASETAQRNLEDRLSDVEAESAALGSTLNEYRESSNKWRREIDEAESHKETLRVTIEELRGQIADGLNVRDNMRNKLERIHTDMAAAAEQLANERAFRQNKNEEMHKRHAVLQARYDAEIQSRSGLDAEIQRLRIQASEGASAQHMLEQTLKSNVILADTNQSLRDDLTEQQTSNSRVRRELQDARENSHIEVQRAQILLQGGIEAANNQADAMRAGLESRLAITNNELDNMRALVNATKARHDVLLQEEADLRRDTLHKVNEASSAALDELRHRHEENIQYVNTQRDRAIANALQDKQRSDEFWQQRLSLTEAKNGLLHDRIAHLDGRLEIAKAAGQAAVSAAQAAKGMQPVSGALAEPDRISPQALRESILVLQEQLQERESSIERLQQEVASFDTDAPNRLKERDIEITWLRELLAVRSDDLTELISTLSQSTYDRDTVRDAAIRIRTNLQMEQAEKERLISAGSSVTGQAFAGLTNFASPKAVQLAAAIGNWRKGREGSSTPVARRSSAQLSRSQEGDQTPSKRPPSAASFLTGLMTPPASNLRRTPSPSSSVISDMSTPRRPLSARVVAPRSTPTSSKPIVPPLAGFDGHEEPETPLSFRSQSYDDDAHLGGADDELDDDEPHALEVPTPQELSSMPPLKRPALRSLASELGDET